MSEPQPKKGILDIAPYVGGESHVEGVVRVIKLASNETPPGPSPKAISAYKKLAGDLHRYPDGGAEELRQAIAEQWELDRDRLVCSDGSDEMISLLTRAYAGPGDEVLFSHHGFLMYAIATMAAGATAVKAPETALRADVDALLGRVNDRTRILFLANPNNPTGTYLPRGELVRLHAGLPDDVILVIDAAYAEYVDVEDYTAGADLVEAHENVLMLRTFSKIYGLAALRLGWAYGPRHVIDVLHRVRGPFNVNQAAQVAGIAAVRDTAHLAKAKAHNDKWRPWLSEKLGELGLEFTPSVGNFVLARFPGGPEMAAAAADHLRSAGILVRGMVAYDLPDCLRITIGLEDENMALLDALIEFME
jgi:histidinol-phosphate aminotransferase